MRMTVLSAGWARASGARVEAYRSPLRKATPFAAVLLLAACAVGPEYETPDVAVPAKWSDDAEVPPEPAPALSEWWRQLDDPQLDALIQEAIDGNLDVASAKARVRESRASYRQAGGALWPQVDASGEIQRSWSKGQVSIDNQDTSFDGTTQYQAGFDASWELDIFGGLHRDVEAAGYGLEASEDELRATLLTLIGDVASNYAELRGYQARIALAERTAASQRQTRALTQAKYQAGLTTGADVANATGITTSTEADIEALQASYAETLHRLGVLLGRDPAALKDRLADPTGIPVPQKEVPLGVPADILTARPDVRQAERELAQSTAYIGAAEADRYPDISLTGSVGTSALNLFDLADITSIAVSLGPSITIPIFNAGQLEAAVEVAEAQRDQSYIAFRSAVLTALEDVENAAVSLARERKKYDKLAQSAAAYGEANRLARSLYQNGLTSFLEVLDAERSQYSAEDALIVSRVAITTNYIALNKALGGGWDGAVDTTTLEIVDQNTGPHLRRAKD